MSNLKKKFRSNEVWVNNKSNFKSHLIKCQSIMDNIQSEEVVVRAMGKATVRALNLALQLNANNYNTFELRPNTYSVEILEDRDKRPILGADRDAYDPDEIDPKVLKKTTYVPAIEIVVRKNQLELDKIRQAKVTSKFESKKA